MKLVCRLLRWNDQEGEKLRMKMRESTAKASAFAEEISRTVVMKADEIKKMIEDGTHRIP